MFPGNSHQVHLHNVREHKLGRRGKNSPVQGTNGFSRPSHRCRGSVNLNEPVNLMNPKSTATRNAIVRHRSPAGEHTCRRTLAALRWWTASTVFRPRIGTPNAVAANVNWRTHLALGMSTVPQRRLRRPGSWRAATPQKPLSHRWERKGKAPVKRLLPGLDGAPVAPCAAPKHRMCISGWTVWFWNQPIVKS
jgi:hypothetical protein